MVGIAEAIAARGVDVVTFDFPYVHARRKVPDRAPVLGAFEHVLAWTRERAAARGRVFIGKSMGGRMATHPRAPRPGIHGIVVLGYPLRPRQDRQRARRPPAVDQGAAAHRAGTRDAFGSPDDLRAALAGTGFTNCGRRRSGDHSFAVRGRKPADVLSEVAGAIVDWL